MKTNKKRKCNLNVKVKIKKPYLLHDWSHGVDLTMCKRSAVAPSNTSQILRQNKQLELKATH